MTTNLQLALKEVLKGSPLEAKINRSVKHREKLFKQNNKANLLAFNRSEMYKMALRLAQTQRFRGMDVSEIWEIVQNDYEEYHN